MMPPKLMPVRDYNDIVDMLKVTNLSRPWEDKRQENPRSTPSPHRRKRKKRRKKKMNGKAMWADVKRKERENAAAIKIQTQCRTYLAKRNYQRHVNSALRIQTSWRQVTAKREVQGRRVERNRRSATKIQRNWRGKKARNHLKKKQAASLRIQTNWRGKQVRDQMKREQAASLKIQTQWRSKNGRESVRKKRTAVRLQQWFDVGQHLFHRPIRGLIFDLENVVLDTKPVYWPACQAVCQNHNIDCTEERFDKCAGFSPAQRYAALMGTMLNDEKILPMVEEEREWLIANRNKHIAEGGDGITVPWIAEIARATEVIRGDRTNMSIALVSCRSRADVELALLESLLRPNFTAIVTPDDVKNMQSIKDLYQAAATALDLDPIFCRGIAGSYRSLHAMEGAGIVSVDGQHPWRLNFSEEKVAMPTLGDRVTRKVEMYTSLEAIEDPESEKQRPVSPLMGMSRVYANAFAGSRFASIAEKSFSESAQPEPAEPSKPDASLSSLPPVLQALDDLGEEPADKEIERAMSPLMGVSELYADAFGRSRFASIAETGLKGAEPVDAEPSDAEPSDAAPPALTSSPLRTKSKAFDNALASVTKEIEAGAEPSDAEPSDAAPPPSTSSPSQSEPEASDSASARDALASRLYL